MKLPDGFQFSQGSLQDFVDCRRRFRLRYLDRLDWPALQTEPALDNERHMHLGLLFHHMVHQHLIGIPVSNLAKMIHDEQLERWWLDFLDLLGSESTPLACLSDLESLAGIFPEYTLSAPMGAYRLMAKYDLVISERGGRFVIVDWKTSLRKPRRDWLAKRLQSRLYPYLLVMAGTQINQGQPLEPDKVEMIYWYTEYPDQPERFAYNLDQFEQDGIYLEGLIAQILREREGGFPLTTHLTHCNYCVYRSFCDRGVRAGFMDEFEDDLVGQDDVPGITLDFEQIPEVEF
jgi:CRISPR/Cas system-associated exonuclease Cas4 (RecB family)